MELTLTIVPGSDPIAGRIRLEDGAELSFCGYMQLVGALERVREGALGRGAGDPPSAWPPHASPSRSPPAR